MSCRYGGALDVQAPCALALYDSELRGNSAATSGGALALSGLLNSTYLELRNTAFAANVARTGADIVQTSNATIVVAAGADGTRVGQLRGAAAGGVRYAPRTAATAAAGAVVGAAAVADRVRMQGVTYPALLTGDEAWLLEARQVRSLRALAFCGGVSQSTALASAESCCVNNCTPDRSQESNQIAREVSPR
jgi:hypothetical protein